MFIVGISGVFLVLIFLSLIIWGIRELDKLFDRKKNAATAVATSAGATIVKSDDEEQRRLIAVLTAAASATLGKNVVIQHFAFLNNGGNKYDWVESGRFSLMSSHLINKKDNRNER